MGKKGRNSGSSPSSSSLTKSKKQSGSSSRLCDSPKASNSQDDWAVRVAAVSKVTRLSDVAIEEDFNPHAITNKVTSDVSVYI